MKRLLKYKNLALRSILLISILGISTLTSSSFVLAASTPAPCTLSPTNSNYVSQCCDTSNGNIVSNASTCLFAKYINPAVALLSAMVGLVVVVTIILGAIEYIGSGGDPQRTASGRQHIINALIGLFAYILLFAFLQFLIPGGL